MDATRPSVDALTFGCRLNIVESQAMRAAAEAAGERNLLIVNTCAVTAEATRQAAQAIRRAGRDDPSRRIVVTGCAAEIDPARFAGLPNVERIIANADKTRPEVWGPARAPQPVRALHDDGKHTRAFVDIQNGCDHRCTFCIIPYGRGASRSRPLAEVVETAKALVAEGRKEIVLTGVDITAWGVDLAGGLRLGTLVTAILERVPDLARLRLSSIDCSEVDELFWDALAQDSRLMPHLHLSLQSGCDLTLKRMKRRHSRADAIRFCERARQASPSVAIGADIIVGFPTETEEMFERSVSLVDDCGLSFLHVFPYSARAGTPAARMPPVAAEAIKARAARLRQKGDEILYRRLDAQIGSVVRVLVERDGRGHAEDFARVKVSGAEPGMLADARVTGRTGRELEAVALHASRNAASDHAYVPAPPR